MNFNNFSHNITLFYLLVFSTLYFSSCTASKTSNLPTKATTLKQNNMVVEKGELNHTGSGQTQIIFKGKNNLLEIINNQQMTHTEGKAVIIVKGNGNMITIDSAQIASARFVYAPGKDTLVILSNQQKFVFKNGAITLPSSTQYSPHPSIQKLSLKTRPFNRQRFLPDFAKSITNKKKVKLVYFGGQVKVQRAVNHFMTQIEQNDHNGYVELGDLYREGKGTKVDMNKAIELYQLGAIKNHILSIVRLGDLHYFGQGTFKPNTSLAQFYYKIGRDLGDAYCESMIE